MALFQTVAGCAVCITISKGSLLAIHCKSTRFVSRVTLNHTAHPQHPHGPRAQGEKTQVSNYTVAGHGVAFCVTPLIQTRAYFEVTIAELAIGHFTFVLGSEIHSAIHDSPTLSQGQPNAWCLSSGANGGDFKANDVIGVTFDLSEVIPLLQFYKNGVHIPGKDIKGIRGDVFPAVSVSGSCMLSANFGDSPFKTAPRPGFDRVIFSRDVL